MLGAMDQESIENVVLFLLLAFLVGIMVTAGFLFVAWIPDFARFLFIVWYVLTV
jgi:hypothetical protein